MIIGIAHRSLIGEDLSLLNFADEHIVSADVDSLDDLDREPGDGLLGNVGNARSVEFVCNVVVFIDLAARTEAEYADQVHRCFPRKNAHGIATTLQDDIGCDIALVQRYGNARRRRSYLLEGIDHAAGLQIIRLSANNVETVIQRTECISIDHSRVSFKSLAIRARRHRTRFSVSNRSDEFVYLNATKQVTYMQLV